MKNRCLLVTTIAAVMVLSVAFMPSAVAETGNGAPSGPHYNLNILGKNQSKNFDFDGINAHDNGHRLFVKLNRDGSKVTTRINLVMGDTFQVIDPDGTDGTATLMLMDPYPTDEVSDEEAAYRIYVRGLGKPGPNVKANITSGFIDEFGNEWLSVETVTVERKGGKSVFSDKTLELTTIYVDMTDDDMYNPVRYPLFGNELWDYFWDYDNYGLKLCQMRIYLTGVS